MAINQTTIFNNFLDPEVANLSAEFSSGIGFYLIAPAAAAEYQIDIFLQVQLAPNVIRSVRLDPSNISTTERITLLPAQITELNLPMRLAILPSQGFLLEIILLASDCSICSIASDLADLQSETSSQKLLLDLLLQALNIALPATPITASAASISSLRSIQII